MDKEKWRNRGSVREVLGRGRGYVRHVYIRCDVGIGGRPVVHSFSVECRARAATSLLTRPTMIGFRSRQYTGHRQESS